MLKAVFTLTLLSLSLSFPSLSQAQDVQNPGVPGICELHHRSGYLVVDEVGNLVDLANYCQRQRDQVEPRTSLFWQAFKATANSQAIAVANTLGPDEVVAYGSTICPFLDQGGTLPELRQIQGDGELPSEFEVAVTVAAIQAYCPVYQSELGR